MSLVVLVVIMLVPVVQLWLARRACAALAARNGGGVRRSLRLLWSPRSGRFLRWYARPHPATAAGPPLERHCADLRRLSQELDRLEASDLPAKGARLRAAGLAYDDVLLAACRALEVPAPARAPLAPLDRLETEAALARCGLLW